MTLNNLYELAVEKDIEIATMPLPYIKGISTLMGGVCYIGLDNTKTESTAEEKGILAHEIGHCVTGAFYNVYSPYDIKSRHECRADRWAIRKLVPLGALKAILKKGISETYELAEFFEVPEYFMVKALNFYKNIGGVEECQK